MKFFTKHPPFIPGALIVPESHPPSRSARPSSGSGSGRARGSDRNDDYSSGLWKLAGLGMTMTSEVVGGALLGWGLDYLLGTTPILLITLTVLGVGVGMTGFIRAALGASGDAGRSARTAVAEGRAAPLPELDDEDPAEEVEEDDFEAGRAPPAGAASRPRSPDGPEGS